MKTTIKFPKGLIESQYNSTLVSIFVSLIVSGIMLITSYNFIDLKNDHSISSLIICGVFVSIIAAIVISFWLKQDVLASNGSELICKTVYFKESVCNKIIDAANNDNWAIIDGARNSGSGTAMRIEVVRSKDGSFAAYQLFKYIPHVYEKFGDITYVEKKPSSSMSKIYK